MDIIVAVDADWGIGKDGDLLQRISADMKYFRENDGKCACDGAENAGILSE